MFGRQANHAPAHRVPVKPRCCVRCKTPYFCGNPECSCHPKRKDDQ